SCPVEAARKQGSSAQRGRRRRPPPPPGRARAGRELSGLRAASGGLVQAVPPGERLAERGQVPVRALDADDEVREAELEGRLGAPSLSSQPPDRGRADDLGGVAADLLAPALEHGDLVPQRLGRPEGAPLV